MLQGHRQQGGQHRERSKQTQQTPRHPRTRNPPCPEKPAPAQQTTQTRRPPSTHPHTHIRTHKPHGPHTPTQPPTPQRPPPYDRTTPTTQLPEAAHTGRPTTHACGYLSATVLGVATVGLRCQPASSTYCVWWLVVGAARATWPSSGARHTDLSRAPSLRSGGDAKRTCQARSNRQYSATATVACKVHQRRPHRLSPVAP